MTTAGRCGRCRRARRGGEYGRRRRGDWRTPPLWGGRPAPQGRRWRCRWQRQEGGPCPWAVRVRGQREMASEVRKKKGIALGWLNIFFFWPVSDWIGPFSFSFPLSLLDFLQEIKHYCREKSLL
jgi:hypothetical protein